MFVKFRYTFPLVLSLLILSSSPAKAESDTYLERRLAEESLLTIDREDRVRFMEEFEKKQGHRFRKKDMPTLYVKSSSFSDQAFLVATGARYKHPALMTVCSVFLGEFGIDRFLLGQRELGLLKLATLGGLGVWYVIDWFAIADETRKVNFSEFLMNGDEGGRLWAPVSDGM